MRRHFPISCGQNRDYDCRLTQSILSCFKLFSVDLSLFYSKANGILDVVMAGKDLLNIKQLKGRLDGSAG